MDRFGATNVSFATHAFFANLLFSRLNRILLLDGHDDTEFTKIKDPAVVLRRLVSFLVPVPYSNVPHCERRRHDDGRIVYDLLPRRQALLASLSFTMATYLYAALWMMAVSVRTGNAFVTPGGNKQQQQQWRQPQSLTTAVGSTSASRTPLQPLALFGRGKSEKEGGDSNDPKDVSNDKRPFYARFGRKAEAPGKEGEEDTLAVASVATETLVDPTPVPSRPEPWAPPQTQSSTPSPKQESLSPAEKAAAMRAQAEKMRLEAERMDVELTLKKITKLERELTYAKAKETKGEGADLDSSVADLRRELEILANKMNGDAPPKASATVAARRPVVEMKERAVGGNAVTTSAQKGPSEKMKNIIEPFSETAFQETLEAIKDGPPFFTKTLATQVGMEFNDVKDVNTTELALRLDKMNRLDFSYSDLPRPTFSQTEIDRKMEMMKELKKKGLVDKRLLEGAKDDDRELALLSLEQDYYSGMNTDWSPGKISKILQGEEWLKPVLDMVNKTAVDSTIESLYPQCMRKEGQTPTMPQMQQLISDVLPKASFSATSKPEPVEGGYVIRGTNKLENGDLLIEAIDKLLAKSSLGEKMTVLYTNDFTIFGKENLDEIDFEEAPILYVTGPDVVREPRRILLSVVSALGIASAWYLSIYPFLLNPALSQRVEQDLALVDASMSPDLSWLTDLSIPLFYTFFGIQLLHDFAHQAVAASYGVSFMFPLSISECCLSIADFVN
jgi:hypothetical protein